MTDPTAEAIGEALLHERAQLPPVIIGQCEEDVLVRPYANLPAWPSRCRSMGLLMKLAFLEEERFLCPAHGATLERAVRRWPR